MKGSARERGYTEPRKRRFHITSEDEFSRERIQAIKETYRELYKEFPQLSLGMTVYGSLVKDKRLSNKETALSTDVDHNIFLDLSAFEKQYHEIYGHLTRIKAHMPSELQEHPAGTLEEPPFWFVSTWLEHYLTYRIAQAVYCAANPEADMGIDTEAERRISYLRDRYAVQPLSLYTYRQRGENETDLGPFAVIKRYTEGLQNLTANDSIPFIKARSIAQLFLLDVGGGMKPYRRAFFTGLLTLEESQRQELWKIIRTVTEGLERRDGMPDTVKGRLPEKWEDALAYYQCSDLLHE